MTDSVASSVVEAVVVPASASGSSSSSMFNPKEINLLILDAKELGSSKENPEVNKAVSYNNVVKSLTVLSSAPSVSTFFLNSLMIGDFGEISKVFLEDIWSVDQLVRHNNLLNLVTQDVFQSLGQWFEFLDLLLSLSLLLLGLFQLEVFGDVNQLLVFELLQLGHGVFVNWVNQEQHFELLSLQSVQEWRLLNSLDRLTSDVVDVLLVLWHSCNIVGQRSQFFRRLGGVESQQLGQRNSVLLILVDTQLDVLGEGIVELVELLGVFSDLVEGLDQLLDNVLLDNLQDLVLLQDFSGQVQWQVLGIHDTLNETQPFRNQVLGIIGDEHTLDVQLDVVLLLLGLESIEWRSLWNEQDGLEFQLTLNREVLDGQWVFPVVGDRLVEGVVLLLGDIRGVSGPQRFGLVQLFGLGDSFLNLLGLFLVVLLTLVFNLFQLRLLVIIFLDFFLLLVLNWDLLFDLLSHNQLDGVRHELRVSLDNLLDSLLLQVLQLVLLQEQTDDGTSAQSLVGLVQGDGEFAASVGFPDVLFVIVVLRDDLDVVSNQEQRVETNTELTDHSDVGTSRQGLHESLGTGFGNGTQVVDQVGLGQTDTGITDLQHFLFGSGGDSDEQLRL